MGNKSEIKLKGLLIHLNIELLYNVCGDVFRQRICWKGEIIIKKLIALLLVACTILAAGCQVKTGNMSENKEVESGESNQGNGTADSISNENQKEEPKTDGRSSLDIQREYIREKKNPIEMKEWMDGIIDGLPMDDATVMVAYYEEYLINCLSYYEDKMSEEDYQSILFNECADTAELENIKVSDAGLQSLLDEIYDTGYKIKTAEGYFFPVVDYTHFLQYEGKISGELYDYFAAMAVESEQSYASDASLAIDWDELASRINAHETYLDKYPSSIREGEMQRNLLYYLNAYFFGLDNTPAFDYESNKFSEEMLESYQNSIKNYPNTELAKILDEYVEILEANDYKLTENVGIYQTDLMEALIDKLDSRTYRYYGMVIEKKKVDHDKHDISYPVLSGMENQALQDKINQRLYESISSLLEDGDGEEYDSTIWADYQVQRFDEDVLSITYDAYSYMEGAAHPNLFLISVNINPKTGEDYSLDQLFSEGYDYKKILNEEGEKQIELLELPLIDEFKGIEDEQEFYLTQKELVIFYQPYVYTPYAYGPLKLYYNYSDLEHLIIPKP